MRLVIDICLLESLSGELIFIKLENVLLSRREFDGDGVTQLVLIKFRLEIGLGGV